MFIQDLAVQADFHMPCFLFNQYFVHIHFMINLHWSYEAKLRFEFATWIFYQTYNWLNEAWLRCFFFFFAFFLNKVLIFVLLLHNKMYML